MPNTDYDSDSSASLTDLTRTNVTLGYASTIPTDDAFSQLGGTPTWPSPTAPSAAFASCKSCNDIMPLLLQLNADLPDRFPGHERRLYIWGCRKRGCRRKEGAVRGLRGVKRSAEGVRSGAQETTASEAVEDPEKDNIGAALFGGTAPRPAAGHSNPFTSTRSSTGKPNPFASAPAPLSSLAAKPSQKPHPPGSTDLPQTFAEKARISPPSPRPSNLPTPPRPWTQTPKPYPRFHIEAESEYLAPDTADGSASSAYTGLMDTSTSDAGESAREDKTLYESAHDKTFQHFADVLGQNPEQVLRYDFGGTPLLYSHEDGVGRVFHHGHGAETAKVRTAAGEKGLPRCGHCGHERVFELQITPHAIAELEGEEDAAVVLREGLEWGSVLLGVCGADCAGEGWEWREEWVGVQWEEVVQGRG